MEAARFSYPSADHKTRISGYLWECESDPKGVILMSHGFTEHLTRHEDVANYFVARGYHFAGIDHIGHGLSMHEEDMKLIAEGYNRKWDGGENSRTLPGTMSLPAGGWDYLVEDFITLMEEMKYRFPDLPLYPMGFSLGSVVIRDALTRRPELAAKAIIIATSMMSATVFKILKATIRLDMCIEGRDKPSAYGFAVFFDSYNRQYPKEPGRFRWLNSTRSAMEAFEQDPLCVDYVTAGFVYELCEGFVRTYYGVDSMSKNLPCLLISGQEDCMSNKGVYVKKMKERMEKLGIPVEMKLYPGMRHDILHETGREEVLEDIYKYLEKA